MDFINKIHQVVRPKSCKTVFVDPKELMDIVRIFSNYRVNPVHQPTLLQNIFMWSLWPHNSFWWGFRPLTVVVKKVQTECRYIAVLKAACNVINMPHDIKKSLLVNTFSNKPNKVYATFLCVLTAALVYIMKPFRPHLCLRYLEEIQKLLIV